MTEEKFFVDCPKCGRSVLLMLPKVQIMREGSVKLPRTEGMKQMIKLWMEDKRDIVIDHEGQIWCLRVVSST